MKTTTMMTTITTPSQKELLCEPAWNCDHRSEYDKQRG